MKLLFKPIISSFIAIHMQCDISLIII